MLAYINIEYVIYMLLLLRNYLPHNIGAMLLKFLRMLKEPILNQMFLQGERHYMCN